MTIRPDIISPQEFTERVEWPLDRKIRETQERIAIWCERWGRHASMNVSGGLDSTVLRHIARNHPEIDGRSIPQFFSDTGAEYPEIRKFVRSLKGVTWVRPKMKFHEVLKRYGYPVVSKRISQYVGEVKRAKSAQTVRLRLLGIKEDGSISPMSRISRKWQFLVGAPFKISEHCCNVIKKAPLNGCGHPLLGMRALECKNREKTYLQYGCNAFDIEAPRSWPLAFWTDGDIREYIAAYKLDYCELYDMGYHRTGCFPCAFGVHLEPWPNKFQLMQKTHPKLWNLCMDRYGLQRVFEYMNQHLKAKERISFEWNDYVARQQGISRAQALMQHNLLEVV